MNRITENLSRVIATILVALIGVAFFAVVSIYDPIESLYGLDPVILLVIPIVSIAPLLFASTRRSIWKECHTFGLIAFVILGLAYYLVSSIGTIAIFPLSVITARILWQMKGDWLKEVLQKYRYHPW